MLYGMIGDVGRFGKLQNVPMGADPDDTSILFRLEDDGTPPADNPYAALGGAMSKVYGFGIRNGFGLDFDPLSGDLWQTENGPDAYDEVNRVARGFNSGWSKIMGPDARDPQGLADLWYPTADTTFSDPEFAWFAPVAPAAIHFLRSDALGATYRNDCFVGAYNTRSIFRFEPSTDRTTLVMPDVSVVDRVADNAAERDLFLWGTGFDGGIVDLDTGPDGALYALSFDTGRLYRIARARTSDLGIVPGPRARLVAWPNPFREAMALHAIGRDPETAVVIYSAAGRLVTVLGGRDGSFAWDGRDIRGRPVAAGVYHARLAGERNSLKLVRGD
jgi:glucose/arabinose dehydrogenase